MENAFQVWSTGDKIMVVDLHDIKYPDLTTIASQYPSPYVLLGQELVWEKKYDGSNLRLYINTDGKLEVGSRNMDIASDQFHAYFKATEQFEGVNELLLDAENWNDTYVVFGELLIKGKSPTKVETHDTTSFMMFDIWSNKMGGFFNYTKVHQEAHHNHLPIAELWGTCNVNTLESLLAFRDQMLQKSMDEHCEGVVGKTWNGAESRYFKEKNDLPRYTKVPRVEELGKVVLPPLPDSELTGSVEKVFADLGEKFFDTKLAMPLLAKYVQDECKKHWCSAPARKLFEVYKERIEEIRKGESHAITKQI